MNNIELKLKVNNFSQIIFLLKKIRARYAGSLHHVDTYYHCQYGKIKIREIDNKQFEFIYYNRQNKAGHKISDVQKFTVDRKSLYSLKSIFRSALGDKVVVDKVRKLWLLKHTRIHLDRVKRLGNFLEVETVCDGITFRSARVECDTVINALQLNKYKKIRLSYSDLIFKKS